MSHLGTSTPPALGRFGRPVVDRHGPRRGKADAGYVIAMTALLILPIMAFSSMAIDLGLWYARAEQLQRAADAAALAGAPLLPDNAAADIAAAAVLTKNGISCTAPISCSKGAVVGSKTKYRVTVQDTSVDQVFSTPFRNSVDVARTATAERIRPVPMGSPRNFLGTGDLLTGVAKENMWLSVSGYCARNEHGDRITPYADANGTGTGNCNATSATGSPRYNPEYSANGYFYAVDFPDGATGSYKIEVYDAAHCQFEGSDAGDSGSDGSSAERKYQFIVRNNNSNDPLTATVLSTTNVAPADCATYAGKWVTLQTINNPTGTYYVQVKPVIPTAKNIAEGQNQFGLRAYTGTFSPCTNDPTVAGGNVASVATCPNVYAVSHLGVYAAFSGTTPSFFLASVGAEHAGKSMEVELFDSAEGAQYIELLDPNGNAVTFNWEIACKNAKYQSETATACGTGETAPTGGYGNATSNKLYVGGSGNKPFTQLTQTDLYSDRLLRLKVTLPTNYATLYGANSWWKMRYTVCTGTGCSVGDRTTWSVSIKGDPVRLIPNG